MPSHEECYEKDANTNFYGSKGTVQLESKQIVRYFCMQILSNLKQQIWLKQISQTHPSNLEVMSWVCFRKLNFLRFWEQFWAV